MSGAFVSLRQVSKVYGRGPAAVQALREVSLDLPEGALAVMLGPSGSGKTTLLNIVGGLDVPSSGQVVVGGEDITHYDEGRLTEYRRRTVGFIFQFFNLVASLTALENVELVAELAHEPGDCREFLVRVGLGDKCDRFPSELSGGEQQRIAIARALAKRPRLLLADEPTGSLDAETGTGVLAAIREVCDEEHMTVALVTHNAPVAQMADLVVRMQGGGIVGTTENPEPLAPAELVW